uniref:Uncharacterized protein n=1 Tax=Chelonoidis abingdonii TaxID=106734 RepID=A0A8C0J8N9_CHEAB
AALAEKSRIEWATEKSILKFYNYYGHCQAQWHVPLIPATREAEAGGLNIFSNWVKSH